MENPSRSASPTASAEPPAGSTGPGLNLPADMALLCKHCNEPFPRGITMQGAAKHTAAEHRTADVRFELVALCTRCHGPMTFVRVQGRREIFDCAKCRRTRSVSRRHRENL